MKRKSDYDILPELVPVLVLAGLLLWAWGLDVKAEQRRMPSSYLDPCCNSCCESSEQEAFRAQQRHHMRQQKRWMADQERATRRLWLDTQQRHIIKLID